MNRSRGAAVTRGRKAMKPALMWAVLFDSEYVGIGLSKEVALERARMNDHWPWFYRVCDCRLVRVTVSESAGKARKRK